MHITIYFRSRVIFGIEPSPQKRGKYKDRQRDRFCKQTTYGAEFKTGSPQQTIYNKEIDNQIVSKYSNRVPKSAHTRSVDRTKHRRDQKKYRKHNSIEKQVRHRYDYDNACVSTGKAFYVPDKVTGSQMEYHYHHMGRPGRRLVVDRVVKYKYPSHVGTNYQKDYAKYNSLKAPGGKQCGEPFNVEKEHKIINPHEVEKLTINRIDYQPFKVQPREPKKLKAPPQSEYIGAKSAYQSDFANWGANEIIHEKEPQYPYYT